MAPSEDTGRRERVTRSLNRARAVQLGMLPDPPILDEVEFGVSYVACEELGGDFYDFVQINPNELGIVLADVSGHGLDAALMMAAAKKTLQIHGRRHTSPAEVLQIACEDLADDLPTGSFVTVWYGVLNLQSGLLTYASAGHNPLVHLQPGDSQQVSTHTGKGVVLGASFVNAMKNILEEKTLQLSPGDLVLQYTDGVTEASNDDDELYGMDRLKDAVATAPQEDIHQLIDHVCAHVEEFRAGRVADDDTTVLGFRYVGVKTKDTGGQKTDPFAAPVETNLPPARDTFVGRDREIGEIFDALSEGAANICLIGMAGLGKTRLGLEVARDLMGSFSGGTWFVSLTTCEDMSAVASAIAGAIGFVMGPGEPAEQLSRAMALRGRTLLLLDNAESAVTPVGELLKQLKSLAPDTHCIVTSQLRVNADDAFELTIKPLNTPGAKARDVTLEAAGEYPAIQLFVDRARRVNETFGLNEGNFRQVLGICAELEGVPLAIELAAARMKLLAPREVFSQLKSPTNKIAVLRTRAGELAAPYQSMREALEWSYGHLEEWEQAAFRQMAAFRGGFLMEAAEAVLDVSSTTGRHGTIEAIDSLLYKSFLWRDSTPYGTRFNTYSALREFASRLTEPHESAEFRKRHMAYFSEYAGRFQGQLYQKRFIEAGERLSLDMDNLIAALDTAFHVKDEGAALNLIKALISMRQVRSAPDVVIEKLLQVSRHFPEMNDENNMHVMHMRSQMCLAMDNHEHSVQFLHDADEFLARLPSGSHAANLKLAIARVCNMLGEDERTEREIKQALKTFEEINEPIHAANARSLLSAVYGRRGRNLESLELVQEAERGYAEAGREYSVALARANQMSVLTNLGRTDEAEALMEKVLPMMEKVGGGRGLAHLHMVAGRIHQRKGELEEALEEFFKAARLNTEAGQHFTVAIVSLDIGSVSQQVGDYDAARRYTDESIRIAESIGSKPALVRALGLRGTIELEDGQFVDAASFLRRVYEETATMNEPVIRLTTRALLAITEAEAGHFDEATKLIQQSAKDIEKMEDEHIEQRFAIPAIRARILHLTGKAANANRFAATAREIAKKHGLDRYHSMSIVRYGFNLIDVPASPAEAKRVRVRCAVCGQRFQGSQARIKALKKCLKCGTQPFKSLKVTDSEVL